ncbi:glycosyl transferase family 2 [Striga asiatica]|uniref:Glycosyl transferase family 2 n=1 Tax=Striga asiatica TaxID=4170 RepID=A0A5A7QLZ1_STRAF|nr:glycosyl transferase family 2 [Striga asiatica]
MDFGPTVYYPWSNFCASSSSEGYKTMICAKRAAQLKAAARGIQDKHPEATLSFGPKGVWVVLAPHIDALIITSEIESYIKGASRQAIVQSSKHHLKRFGTATQISTNLMETKLSSLFPLFYHFNLHKYFLVILLFPLHISTTNNTS